MFMFGIVQIPAMLILPSLVNPFGLYLMRVFWEASVPTELVEAARIDGAGEICIFWGIGTPLMLSGLVRSLC
jgi:multiple sugar transport system permease protein